MVISTLIREGIRYLVSSTGAGLIPKGYRAYRKFDVKSTNLAFGRSGGKGFRHGRDVGLIIGGQYLSGDDLDDAPVQPRIGTPSYQQSKTRRGYKWGNNYRRTKYNRACRPGRQSKYYR